MVERLNPDQVFGFGSRAETEAYCDRDLLIRTGRCPNGCGLMLQHDDGQDCPKCQFATNCRCELAAQ